MALEKFLNSGEPVIQALDKRRYKRVDCDIESSFNNLDGTKPHDIRETTIRDISEGGIRFRSNEFIPIHNRLLFKLDVPKKKSIRAIAKPAWIREVPSLSQYEIGASFQGLSEEDISIIRNLAAV